MTDWLEKALALKGEALFSEHPDSELLVCYAEEAAAMTPAEAAAIEAHLDVCGVCADDLSRLNAAAKELSRNQARPAVGHFRGWRRLFAGLLSPERWLPAAAVALVALVYINTMDHPMPPAALSVGQAVVLPMETERGAVTTIRPGAGANVTLMFELASADEAPIARCDVRVYGPEGSGNQPVASVMQAQATDDFGTFVVILDARLLQNGRHVLVAHDRFGERRFNFEVSNTGNGP